MASSQSRSLEAVRSSWDSFEPHPLIRNGHVQTIAGYLFNNPPSFAGTHKHILSLRDGDQLVLHDDTPAAWQAGRRLVLLVHGVEGDHRSPYVKRLAHKLHELGIRTVRMDLRCCGDALSLSHRPYHAGQSEDVADAVLFLGELCPASPVSVVGISMGGNIALKLLGEVGADSLGQLDSAVALSPPVALRPSVEKLGRLENRAYNLYFAKLLLEHYHQYKDRVRYAERVQFQQPPRTVFEFDEQVTAPLWGFASADDYYERCSSLPLLGRIALPTLILAARDDPSIPPEPLLDGPRSSSVQLHMLHRGGHLGFISNGRGDPDRRWMDWRVVEWIGQLPRAGV